MKVSVSLPQDDVEFLDAYAEAEGLDSRSAAVHQAVRLLRVGELTPAYEEAWQSWASSDEAGDWDVVSADGLRT